MPIDRAKVYAVTTKIENGGGSGDADEVMRARRIASDHGLSEEGLVDFIAEIRRQARHRRQRMADSQIETLVGQLGKST